jgi:hypothetical protein
MLVVINTSVPTRGPQVARELLGHDLEFTRHDLLYGASALTQTLSLNPE